MSGTLWLYLLLILSGAAGIAYQTIWTKMFAVALGHEIPSLFAVVTAFFGGLSVGSVSLHQRIKRSHRPEYWYAFLELVIAAWVLVLFFLQPHLSDWVIALLSIESSQSHHWLVSFLLSVLLLFPATFAMGATLPAMEQALARRSEHQQIVGGAYAMNTLGAVFGVLLATFWLLPTFGQHISLLIFVGINLFCALGIGLLSRMPQLLTAPNKTETITETGIQETVPDNQPGNRYLLIALFATGLLGIGFEILCIRIMSQVFEGTLYSFATALSVYLVASALGALLYQRYSRQLDIGVWLPRLLTLLAYSCLTGLFILYYSEPIYRFLRINLGDTPLEIFISEMAIAGSVFFIPSLLMGVTFSLLAQAHRNNQHGLGQALAINTLGGALAPSLFGLILLPMTGAKWALGILASCYLLLMPNRRAVILPVSMLMLAMFFVPDLEVITLRDNEQLLAYREGVTANSAVVERGHYRNLRVNNRYQMGGTSPETVLFQRRQAHIPLLLHPDAQNSLFLGVASGVTMGTATLYPGLEIDAVDLVPEVLELLEYFSPANNSPQRHPRVNLYAADARRFVRTKDTRYDVIIADLFHPSRDGAGLLFTQEHYQAIRERLAPGGIFCHWLPLHQLNNDMIAVISQTFLTVFPDARLVLSSTNINYPTLGLVTGININSLRPGYIINRVQDATLQKELQNMLINNDLDLFSALFLDTETLQKIAGSAPVNTDAFPIVSYQSPMFTYQRSSKKYGRLISLMKEHEADIGSEIVKKQSIDDFRQRLRNYISARNLYIDALRENIENGKAAAIDNYFSSVKASSDFNSSYAQLFKIALGYAQDKTRKEEALVIIEELYRIRPLPKVKQTLNSLRNSL